MGSIKHSSNLILFTCLFFVFFLTGSYSAVHEFNPDIEQAALYRKARDDRYYLNRYGSAQGSAADRGHRGALKPGDSHPHPEARAEGDRDRDRDRDPAQGAAAGLEKRCIRCTTSYYDPYDYRDYQDRDRYYDRYDDRRYNDPYDYRMTYDRHDNRYDRYDRDRWYDRRSYYDYDRPYYRGGYDRYDRGYDRSYDRYDRNYDRGFGYDNRGYDYRRVYDSRMRPWEDSARSAYDQRNYYYPSGGSGRNDYWGYDRGYASGYNYGRDNWRDPYRRDPYNYDGYRGTSYLYDRNPSPQTTPPSHPSKDDAASGGTDRPGVGPDSKPTDGSGSG